MFFRDRTLALLIAAIVVAASNVFGAALERPEALLETGHADQALSLLRQTLSTDKQNADALNLECRVYFSEGLFSAAEAPCASAVSLAPNSSSDHLWLGRVLGREAEHASPLDALSTARRAHAQFEEAYRLDPHNADAVSDLASYYIHAPRLLGGGDTKALALASAAEGWNPALADSVRAEQALAKKNAAAAEQQLRAATAAPGASAEDWVALASFYREQGRTGEMLNAVDEAVAMDRAHDAALVSAAQQLIESHQRTGEAISLLRTYLASPNQSEAAPAFSVHARLAMLLLQSGDQQGANVQLTAAHALASQWQPRHSAVARTGASPSAPDAE